MVTDTVHDTAEAVAAAPEPELSLTEFSARVGRCETTVSRLIRAGTVRSVRRGRSIRVPESEVARLREHLRALHRV